MKNENIVNSKIKEVKDSAILVKYLKVNKYNSNYVRVEKLIKPISLIVRL
jgi:hypothetical protein